MSEADLVRRYLAGEGASLLRREAHLTFQTVYRILRDAGVKIRTHGQGTRLARTQGRAWDRFATLAKQVNKPRTKGKP